MDDKVLNHLLFYFKLNY